MLPCVHALILLKVLQFMDYVVHILDLVRHDKLHPWKTCVAYYMFWGKMLLCLIFVLILYWVCMLCDTCSVTFMVLFTMRLLHVVPPRHNNLVFYA